MNQDTNKREFHGRLGESPARVLINENSRFKLIKPFKDRTSSARPEEEDLLFHDKSQPLKGSAKSSREANTFLLHNFYSQKAMHSPKDKPQERPHIKTAHQPREPYFASSLNDRNKNKNSQVKKMNDKLDMLYRKMAEMSRLVDARREEKYKFFQEELQKRSRVRKDKTGQKGSSLTPKEETPKDFKLQNEYSMLRELVTQVPEQADLSAAKYNPYSLRFSLYYIAEIVKFYKDDHSISHEHVNSSMNSIRFFKDRVPPPLYYILQKAPKCIKNEQYKGKKTVVFDLDYTLIHCNEKIEMPHDIKIDIAFPKGEVLQAGINVRPYAIEILKALAPNFYIIVFTASQSFYASVVMDRLDPKHEYVQHIFYRYHCVLTPEGAYVKDLRMINRDLAYVVLVDNAAHSYAYQLDNGIPIIPYYKGRNDYELPALQTYLYSLMFVRDVREVNRKIFKLHRYIYFTELDKLVYQLYSNAANDR